MSVSVEKKRAEGEQRGEPEGHVPGGDADPQDQCAGSEVEAAGETTDAWQRDRVRAEEHDAGDQRGHVTTIVAAQINSAGDEGLGQ